MSPCRPPRYACRAELVNVSDMKVVSAELKQPGCRVSPPPRLRSQTLSSAFAGVLRSVPWLFSQAIYPSGVKHAGRVIRASMPGILAGAILTRASLESPTTEFGCDKSPGPRREEESRIVRDWPAEST